MKNEISRISVDLLYVCSCLPWEHSFGTSFSVGWEGSFVHQYQAMRNSVVEIDA
jgi:hypothetical protein